MTGSGRGGSFQTGSDDPRPDDVVPILRTAEIGHARQRGRHHLAYTREHKAGLDPYVATHLLVAKGREAAKPLPGQLVAQDLGLLCLGER